MSTVKTTNITHASNSGTANIVLDNSGNVTASGTLTISGTGQKDLIIGSTNAGGAAIALDGDSNGDASGSDYALIRHNTSGQLEITSKNPSGGTDTIFKQGSDERMRIRSDGNILIGMADFSSTPSASNHGISLHNTNNASVWAAGSATTNTHIIWANTNGTCGTIQTEGTGTSYNTSSDYRLKENIVGITDGITRVKQLAPKRFNFKTNASKVLDGFLAHEVTPIVPEAVSGTKDEVDSDDKIVPQGIDQAKLVPLLTAALQEAIAKIETLETKVAALEAA